MKKNLFVVTGLTFGLLLLGGCAVKTDPAMDFGLDLGTTVKVKAKDFAEACMELEKGARVEYSFSSTRPLDFDIHYHITQETKGYPVKEIATKGESGEFSAEVKETYCLMWVNKGWRSSLVNYDFFVINQ